MLSSLQRDLTQKEQKEQLVLEKRQKENEERRQRFLNPRQRTMGLDIDTLEKQIAEKKDAEEQRKREERAYDESIVQMEQNLIQMEAQVQAERKSELNQLNDYRMNNQGMQTRREFDISLPGQNADRERCGVSSLQTFEGEDSSYGDRKIAQKDQMQMWSKEQMMYKQAAQRSEQEEEMKYQQSQLALGQQLTDLHNDNENKRRQASNDVLQCNKRMAEEKALALKQEKQKEEDEINAYKASILSSKMLREEGSKDITDFKGMRMDEIQRIREIQKQQEQDRKRQQALEQEEELRFQQMTIANERNAILSQRNMERNLREEHKAMNEENSRIASQANSKYQHLYNNEYSSQPNDAYFKQFGTSAR